MDNSNYSGGFVLSWKRSGAALIAVIINEAGRATTHTLDRQEGVMVIPPPEVPYTIGYRADNGPVTVLATRGEMPKSPAKPTGPPRGTRVVFNTGVEVAQLQAPVQRRRVAHSGKKTGRRHVDLFIKVNPAGAVAGASTPYYDREDVRALARLAAATAIKSWRFQPRPGSGYRDARLRLSFYASHTTVRSN